MSSLTAPEQTPSLPAIHIEISGQPDDVGFFAASCPYQLPYVAESPADERGGLRFSGTYTTHYIRVTAVNPQTRELRCQDLGPSPDTSSGTSQTYPLSLFERHLGGRLDITPARPPILERLTAIAGTYGRRLTTMLVG